MNCKVCNNTTTTTPGIPFFRFPREVKKCERWAELCHLRCSFRKKGTNQFHKSFRICSDHFDADEMMHDGRKVRLFPLAEPKFLLKKFRRVKKKKREVIKKFNIDKITLPNHICRLCAEEKDNVISIYGWRGKNTYNLEKKLKYFPFAIDKCDVLPLGVCEECMVKVDLLVDFIENSTRAQMKLKELLSDYIYSLTVQLADLDNPDLVQNQETQTKSEGDLQILHDGTGEAQNTSLDEDLMNIDISQLLLWNTTKTTNGDETQNTSLTIPSQPPPVSAPDLYQTLMDFPIVEKNQTEQDCPEPEPDLLKFTDDDLLTLYDELTLRNNYSLNCTNTNLATQDQFLPPQITDQTDIIDANFGNIEKLRCGLCLKDFDTLDLLESHLKTHALETNDNDFEKHTTLDVLPDFFEDISKQTEESGGRRDYSDNEPNNTLGVEPPPKPGPPPKENKQNSKRKGKRKKLKPECEFCEKLFPTFEECEEHEKTHQGIQRYECLRCKAKYRSKKGLRRHIPVHSGEVFPCPQCKTIFRRKDSLLNHGRVHRKFVCKICSFVFKHKATFLKHEKDHEQPVAPTTEVNNAGQANEEFPTPDLPDSLPQENVPTVLEAPVQFLASANTIQPTCILVPVTKMDGIEQIVVTQIVAMET